MDFPKKCNFAQKHLVRSFYSFLVQLAGHVLSVIALFNSKMALFVHGRKMTFSSLEAAFSSTDKVIWMHVASLGEYEQGLPVLQALKDRYPEKKFLLTFFSPSGYEVKKDKTPADVVVYLPLDTPKNVKRFLASSQLQLAIFIKYEIWPNYLWQLQKRSIPTVLVSGIFSKNQIYFKWYGGFMRKALGTFQHYFVQENNSKKLLQGIGFENVTVSGDTRFDRVSQILEQEHPLEFMEHFAKGQPCLVAGSTWPEDEKIIVDYINQTKHDLKLIIAPHTIKPTPIETLKSSLQKKVSMYSSMETEELEKSQVLIVDTIGLLTKIYAYAQFAYVGGGFATGLHNTLEPAVFGIPVIIGPEYQKFNEAIEMVALGGLCSIKNGREFSKTMDGFMANPQLAEIKGKRNGDYIEQNRGATQKVLDYLETLL